MSIRLFKMLLFPSFWWNAFFLAFKEHWVYLVVFTLFFNGSSLMRGEFLEFIISGSIFAGVVAILYIFYVSSIFILKTFKESDFRLMVINQPCLYVVYDLLGLKSESRVIKSSPLSQDLPDKTSKIGFTLLMVVSISTTAGIFYVWYLVANL